MEKTQPPPPPRTVAVVGTGMAGLATAHLLHQDVQNRYRVTLLEKVSLFLTSLALELRGQAFPQSAM